MRKRVLALLLIVSMPIAPAICKGSTRDRETPAPPCHAHPAQPESPEEPAPDDEAQCCAACDAYVSAKLSFDALLQVALVGVSNAPELQAPDWTSLPGLTHPPPEHSVSPFLRHNSPLRI
jgi:hypothetical protein